MANQRVLVGVPVTLTASLLDQNGEPRPPTGDVTVEVKASDGSTILAAGTATTTADDGSFSVQVPSSSNQQLDEWTANWSESGGTSVTTSVAVVGAVAFTIADARSRMKSLAADVVKFPDEDVQRVRLEVEEELQRITGRSCVPRFRSLALNGSGQGWMILPDIDIRRVRSLTVGGTTYAAGSFVASPNGRIDLGSIADVWNLEDDIDSAARRFYAGRSNVAVAYEYGMDAPPADLQRAMITRLRYRLLADKVSISDRATSMTTNDGTTMTLATPGTRDWHTGIPEVDEIYNHYRRDDQSDWAGSVRIA